MIMHNYKLQKKSSKKATTHHRSSSKSINSTENSSGNIKSLPQRAITIIYDPVEQCLLGDSSRHCPYCHKFIDSLHIIHQCDHGSKIFQDEILRDQIKNVVCDVLSNMANAHKK
jgi:hypothetical protein